MIRPTLQLLEDGELYKPKDVANTLMKYFAISEEEKLEVTPVGRKGKFYTRMMWAISTLRNTGLLENTERGVFKITQKGSEKLNVLKNNPGMSGSDFLSQLPEYQDFLNRNKNEDLEQPGFDDEDKLSPQELIDKNHLMLETALHDELLSKIKSMDPFDFQNLVSEVLTSMGYGFPSKEQLPKTRDAGIDGIINQDELGLDKIYLQAKRWDANSVGRDEIQKFVGALSDRATTKGVFITTSAFTADARSFAKQHSNFNIVLVDGQELAKLMCKYNLGVINYKTYTVKKLDYGFFDEGNI